MKPQHKLIHAGAAVLLVITSLVVAPVTPAHAFTIWTVNTLVDESDGSCGDGDCSLRDALALSAANDAISIGSGTIILSLGQLVVAHNITIGGNGADQTIIDANGASRVISVNFGPGAVVLNDMTLTGGSIGGDGGGVSNAGGLNLERVHITGNSTTSGGGGGIYSSGTLNVVDSLIDWNTAANSGGGYGGGLFLNGAATTLARVTVRNNTAEGYSGGIHAQGGGTVDLSNVTLTGNSANQGAAATVTSSTTANFLNSTIAGNTATALNAAVADFATSTFKNTIISGNSPGNCFAGGGSTWTTLGNNLESGTDCGFVGAGDQQSTDPQLTQIANYGGYVPTMTLLGTSPAIDSGTNTGCPTEDARGLSRPVDGPGAGGAVCDKGAVEMRAQTTSMSSWSMNPSPSVVGQDVDAEVTIVGSSTTPTGTVQISAGSLACNPGLDGGGYAICGMNFASPGFRGVLYRYLGDGTHDASQAALSHIVNQASRTDFDVDGYGDPGKFIPSTGYLWWRNTFSGAFHGKYMGGDVAQYIGRSDFDGDGETDPAKYVSSGQSLWYYGSLLDTLAGVYMGSNSYLLPGSDFDKDGHTDPAKFTSDGSIWRLPSSTSTWVGTFIGTDAAPALPGSDYDGDGRTDLAKYVPGAGAIWYFGSLDSTWHGVYIGSDGTPVPASDFDGDGKTDMAKYLSGSNTLWYRWSSTLAWIGVYLGPGTLTYVPASDFDGDGRSDPAKFDTGTKTLWYLNSGDGTWHGIYMGAETYSIVN